MGAKSYRELRAWQSARTFKRAVYRLIETEAFEKQERLRHQLRESAASAASHISEGYGRFDPGDNARFLKMARASLIECQNHLDDALDRGVIDEEVRKQHDTLANDALKEIGGLINYLQSPKAKDNAERIKQKRNARTRGGKPEP